MTLIIRIIERILRIDLETRKVFPQLFKEAALKIVMTSCFLKSKDKI
jgi:hypothetical protein